MYVVFAAAAVRLLDDIGGLSPRSEDGASAARVGAGLVTRWNTIQAEGELGGSTASGLGIGDERIPVDVVKVILGCVIVGVGGLAVSG